MNKAKSQVYSWRPIYCLGQANYTYSFASATSSIYMRAGGTWYTNWQHTSSTGSCLSTALKGVSLDFFYFLCMQKAEHYFAMLACDSLLCCSFTAYDWNKSVEPAFSFRRTGRRRSQTAQNKLSKGWLRRHPLQRYGKLEPLKLLTKNRQRRTPLFFSS